MRDKIKDFDRKIQKCIIDCDDAISDILGAYNTRELEYIILGLLYNHCFTSSDSIKHLIDTLKDLDKEIKHN